MAGEVIGYEPGVRRAIRKVAQHQWRGGKRLDKTDRMLNFCYR